MSSLDDRLKGLMNTRAPTKARKPVSRRKTKDESDIDVTRLDELSDSELVLIANEAGYETVSRQLPREDIIDIILGVGDPPEDVLLPVRNAIHQYVSNHTIMTSVMPCDLNCPKCTHHWVVECFTDNRDLVD